MNNFTYEPIKTFERIREVRENAGISAEFLNDKCRISKNTIAKSATSPNGLSAKILYAVAKTLGCSADYLLGLSENPNQANTNCNVIEHGDNIGNMDITINQAENDFLLCFLKQFQSLTYSEQLEIMNIVNEKAKR